MIDVRLNFDAINVVVWKVQNLLEYVRCLACFHSYQTKFCEQYFEFYLGIMYMQSYYISLLQPTVLINIIARN